MEAARDLPENLGPDPSLCRSGRTWEFVRSLGTREGLIGRTPERIYISQVKNKGGRSQNSNREKIEIIIVRLTMVFFPIIEDRFVRVEDTRAPNAKGPVRTLNFN